ncbi:hypothetical protein [Amycolatopsis rifamycinica]|uniref:Uncharacterized protein n=1 Tax=Amycolatopsis rifamycinica TaxID=287986 RepID=A0A066UGI3_9PSEU|nr:hypothetical protein [Amycolatopsis rifamycinica]KDN23254.1 hypothetical protein DV20_05925 [Amycolatopsis rifamycinica]
MTAVLLASAPAATARAADPPTAGYRECSVLRTIVRYGWAPGGDGRYHLVTFRKPQVVSVVFPVARFAAPVD